MRYSRVPPVKKKASSAPAIIAIALVLCAVAVYLIGANVVADFFAKNVVEPVVALFGGGDDTPAQTLPVILPEEPAEATPDSTETTEQKTITVSATNVFALQAGVFENDANARAVADELVSMGGAGYILEADGKRVLLSAYKTEAEANIVKDNLLASQAMETAIYEISSPEIRFVAQGETDDIKALEDAISAYFGAQDLIYDLIIAYDKQEKSEEQTLADISAISLSLDDAKITVDRIAKGEDNNIVAQLGSTIGTVGDYVKSLESKTGVGLSSGLKYAYICFAVELDTGNYH